MHDVTTTPRQARLVRALLVATLAALITLLLASSLWAALLDNTDSDGGDQGAFLSVGLDIRAGEALTDGNRHPLFAAMMAPMAERDWSYFTGSKLLSLVCTCLGVVGVMVMGGRRLGWPAALLAGAALALNGELIDQGSQVLCEGLLAGLAFLSFAALARLCDEPDDWKCGALAGASLGLVYLTKSAGTMLLGAALIALLLMQRWSVMRRPSTWALIAAFVLVSSPLLVYNLQRYGSPLYNFNSTHAMWFESWDDRYLSSEQWPTMGSYLASHSLAQMAARLGQGLIDVLPVMAEALRLGGAAWTGWAFLMAQGVIVGLGIGLVVRRWFGRAREALAAWQAMVVLAAVRIGVLYVMHAWFFQVTDAARFFLPLAPETMLLVGAALAWAGRRWLPHVARRQTLLLGCATVLAAVLVMGRLADVDFVDPYASDVAANAAAGQVVDHLSTLAHEESITVLFGPSHSLPRWRLEDDVALASIPDDVESPDALDAYIAAIDADLILIDKKMYSRRDESLGPRFDKSGETILFRQAPADWCYLRHWRADEMHWYLLEPSPTGARAELLAIAEDAALQARFGSAIGLLGHAVGVDPAEDGATVTINLLWRAEEAIPADLTRYCHLLDATGQRIAQEDGPAVGGMYPTYLWQPGEAILDQVTLRVDAAAQPAQVLVGWYNWQTKERPEASSAQMDVTDDARAIILPVAP